MPWLNVCSVYRSRGISTRQGRGVASTEARAILARHLPGLFNIFPLSELVLDDKCPIYY